MNGLLKFITCGSVDDGKSTLIGHMLYDAKLIFTDQEKALKLDSKVGSREGKIDYSLLLDGLMAEREQGITIDVAYRYFTTEKRSFIVADTPGHEEYTRNMAVGAAFADLAVILVDASQGVMIQTKRHARICSLMGIRHFVIAVNKMDLVNYSKERFDKIKKQIRILLAEFEYDSVEIIPVSATEGDNITKPSRSMVWYKGKILLEYLEEIKVRQKDGTGFLMPVQRVVRPNHAFRGFQGQIESGSIALGQEITVLPGKEKAKIGRILRGDKDVEKAFSGWPVTLCTDREVDISRGCVLCRGEAPMTGNMFEAKILWMEDSHLVAGKNYLLKLGTKTIPATVMAIRCRIDVNTGEEIPADEIFKNEIAECEISVGDTLVFDRFENTQVLGSLILIDRVSHMTAACGVVENALNRSGNVIYHQMEITKEIRCQKLGQKSGVIWFTGLSGAGKSTLANELEKRLVAAGKHTMLLDGDNVRLGLNKNLGFKEQDRIENIRRISEVAKLMTEAGLIVLTASISPYASDRRKAREIIGDEFVEVYVSTSLEECEKRDVKGLYEKARRGEIPNFTGITSPYEVPVKPEIVINTEGRTLLECVDELYEKLLKFL